MPLLSLVLALARMRPRKTFSVPGQLARAAYLYILTRSPDLGALWRALKVYVLALARLPQSRVHRLMKGFRERLYGKKRALLIGIQTVADEIVDDPVVAGNATVDGNGTPIASQPRAPRKKKSKKKKKAQDALRGPHHDVLSIYNLLISTYGYEPDDIVLLIDDDKHPQPTRDNIISQMKALVKNVRDGDKLFLHYAGHADQVGTTDVDEEDGMNEFILTCDGRRILDNELREILVESLRDITCTLTAVLDCCHSGSLLDLEHIHCNNVYVPWLNKGRRRTKTLWANLDRESGALFPLETSLSLPTAPSQPAPSFTFSVHKPKPAGLVIDTAAAYPTPPPSHGHSREPSFEVRVPAQPTAPAIGVTGPSPPPFAVSFMSPMAMPFTVSPAAMYARCDGMCRENPLQRLGGAGRTGVEVICISAAKDSELAWEDGEGKSMTQYLIQRLAAKPKPTLHDLLTNISHDIHSYYVSELHQEARSYKKKLQALGRRDEDLMASVVEMHNFQNPQLSSILPLDMEQVFDP